MGAERARRGSRARTAASVTVVAVMFAVAVPQMADYSAAWQRVRAMSADGVALVVAVAVWNLASYCFLLMAAMPGLSFRRAALVSQASTAVSNTMPGGGAWGAGLALTMYRSFGHSTEEIARSFAVSGFWNVAVKLTTPAVAVLLLAAGEDAPPPVVALLSLTLLAGAGLAGLALLRRPAVVRRATRVVDAAASRLLGQRTGERARRWADRIEQARADTVALVRRSWLALSAAAAVSHLSLFLVLVVALRQVGVDRGAVSLGEALTAFAILRIALIIPITPGGAGLAEAGLSGMLIAAGGDPASVVAAVLLFRAATWLAPVPIGATAYLLWAASATPRPAVEVRV